MQRLGAEIWRLGSCVGRRREKEEKEQEEEEDEEKEEKEEKKEEEEEDCPHLTLCLNLTRTFLLMRRQLSS